MELRNGLHVGRKCAKVLFLTMTAMPLMSEPMLAAVGDVLGTLSVLVSAMKILSAGMPNARLATCSQVKMQESENQEGAVQTKHLVIKCSRKRKLYSF